MIISFSNVPFVFAVIVGALIIVAHVFPLFVKGNIARWTTVFGAILHPVYFILMFFAGAAFDLVVALLLASVFVYTLLGYISHSVNKRRGMSK